MKNLTINLHTQRLVVVLLMLLLLLVLVLPAWAQTYTTRTTRTVTTPIVTTPIMTTPTVTTPIVITHQDTGMDTNTVTETRIEVTVTYSEPQTVTRTTTTQPTHTAQPANTPTTLRTTPPAMTRTVSPMPRMVRRPVVVPTAPELRPRGTLHGPFRLLRVLNGNSFIADFGDNSDLSSDIVELIAVRNSQDVDYSILLGRLIGGRPFWLELDEFERGFDGNILAYLYVEDLLGDWHWNGLRLTQINLYMLTTGIATYNPGINARYRDIYRQLPEDITYIETVPFVFRNRPDRLVDIDLNYLNTNYFNRPVPFTPR